MNRLAVRLVLSHVLVAVLGGLATFLVVRTLTPALFDRMMGGQGSMMGQGRGGTLRGQVADAVTQALLVGVLVGVVAATAFGAVAARRLVRPLRQLSDTTREIAAGRYDVHVGRPREDELALLADDVNTLGRTLAETESRRVRLLGEVAHEMRTPLTVIEGSVEGMIDGVLAVGPERLGLVSDEVRRLRRLSDDLSALSRSEEGRLGMVLAPADLRTVVATAAERLRPQAEDAGVALGVGVPDDPVVVAVDGDRLGQVVTNLVGNALRATGSGGRIDVEVSSAGSTASVTVTDTGEGLAPEDVERVFERFVRVPERRRSGTDTGSGIGLTIARGIVAAHGGTLDARSPGRGRGATFTARLPLVPAGQVGSTSA
ncbi:HAMP domain-containing histidine kinase [Phycicoccus sp. HDW14]|uniref:sensor histidine kinase n=1 Tax=Phycicoccus sp. HDW14 TaxID=2714941 RepID=UPI00140B0DF8|nr:HAMP domain-containing sensor histidine kinase [Phycicoccus sp. HDW14]QIM20134.1 HAMP domain-containing histidine kinase [Phycicoccus sp. HDW14]